MSEYQSFYMILHVLLLVNDWNAIVFLVSGTWKHVTMPPIRHRRGRGVPRRLFVEPERLVGTYLCVINNWVITVYYTILSIVWFYYGYLSIWSTPPPSCINLVDIGVIWGGDSKNDIQIWWKNIIRVKLGQVRFGYFMSFQCGEVWSSVVIFSLGYVCLCCAKIDYVIVNLDYDDTDFTPRQENTGF